MRRRPIPAEFYLMAALFGIGVIGSGFLGISYLSDPSKIAEIKTALGLSLLGSTVCMMLYTSTHYVLKDNVALKYIGLFFLKWFVYFGSYMFLYVLEVAFMSIGIRDFMPILSNEFAYSVLLISAFGYGYILSKLYAESLRHFLWKGDNAYSYEVYRKRVVTEFSHKYSEFLMKNHRLAGGFLSLLSFIGLVGAATVYANVQGLFGTRVTLDEYWVYGHAIIAIGIAIFTLITSAIQQQLDNSLEEKNFGWIKFIKDLTFNFGVSAYFVVVLFFAVSNMWFIGWLEILMFTIGYGLIMILAVMHSMCVTLGKLGAKEIKVSARIELD